MYQVADMCDSCKSFDCGNRECEYGFYLDPFKVTVECERYENENEDEDEDTEVKCDGDI